MGDLKSIYITRTKRGRKPAVITVTWSAGEPPEWMKLEKSPWPLEYIMNDDQTLNMLSYAFHNNIRVMFLGFEWEKVIQ